MLLVRNNEALVPLSLYYIPCRPKGENIDVKTLAPVGEGEGSEECGGERESE